MSKYQAVLFDLDGTLLDTSEGILSSVKYTIDVMGFEPIDDDLFETFIGPPIQHTLQRIYNLDDATRDKAAAVFRDHYSTVDLCKAKLYDGVLETLSELKKKGIKIAVATYKREDYAAKILDEFGISPYCDWIQGSDFAGKLTIVIDKENEGVSSARNMGIEQATGEYIMFCDSDDSVHPQWCEYMLEQIKRYPADLISCRHLMVADKEMISSQGIDCRDSEPATYSVCSD